MQVNVLRADGVIVSTPTGSTAYSTAAGGPMVVPSTPCIIITPVASRALSCRSIVVADTSAVEIRIPRTSRSLCRLRFDGKVDADLEPGAVVRFTTSAWLLPTVSAGPLDLDWYNRINIKLFWNKRTEQLPG